MQTLIATKPMHESPKLTSFIALRANGWSLAEISYKINVPKSTLWEWDTKHHDQILRLKQLQLEKFQQRFLPTFEEELARLSSYLSRIEAALQQTTFDEMHPGYLLQLSLQLRNRLARLCSHDPVRRAGADQPFPATGCITRHYENQFTAEDIVAALRSTDDLQSSAVNPEPISQTQTKPDETPPPPPQGPLIISDLHHKTGHSRPVLHSKTSDTKTETQPKKPGSNPELLSS